MRRLGLVCIALLVLSAQSPAPATMPPMTHFVYRFGFNTKVADSGPNTGTTTIDVKGVAPDGGLVVDGTDEWWNTVRARQTSECEVYGDGSVMCNKAPNQLSPIQLTIFPLLAVSYLQGLTQAGSSKTNAYKVKAVFIPAASGGYIGQVHTWAATLSYTGTGPIQDSPLVLIESNGSFKTVDGPAAEVTQTSKVGYDPAKHVVAIANTRLAPLHMRSVNSDMLVELRLISAAPHP